MLDAPMKTTARCFLAVFVFLAMAVASQAQELDMPGIVGEGNPMHVLPVGGNEGESMGAISISGERGCPSCDIVLGSDVKAYSEAGALPKTDPRFPCLTGDSDCALSLAALARQHPVEIATTCEQFLSSLSANTVLGLSNGSLYQKPADGLSRSQAVDIIHKHAQYCLSHIIPDSGIRVVGVFVNRIHGNLLGMGTLIDPSHVLTAKHVLYEAEGDQATNRLNPDDLVFIPAKSPTRALALDESTFANLPPIANFNLLSQTDDHVVVALRTAADLPVTDKPEILPPPRTPTQIAVIGVNEEEMEADGVSFKHGENVDGTWVKYLAMDPRPTCETLTVTDAACVIHGCTTFAGTSGTGVLDAHDLSASRTTLYAVHVGTPQVPCSGNISGGIHLNVAVAP